MMPRVLLGLLVSLGLLGLLVVQTESCSRHKRDAGTQKAQELKGGADAHAEAGRDQASEAQAIAAEREAIAQAEVDRLKAELAALKRRIQPRSAASQDAPVSEPPVVVRPEPGVGPGVSDLQAVIAKQDQVIAAQDVRNAATEERAKRWEAAYRQADAAFRMERDRSLSLELALEAQKSMTRGALWRGRLQGIAVGFAAGYVGAKR